MKNLIWHGKGNEDKGDGENMKSWYLFIFTCTWCK